MSISVCSHKLHGLTRPPRTAHCQKYPIAPVTAVTTPLPTRWRRAGRCDPTVVSGTRSARGRARMRHLFDDTDVSGFSGMFMSHRCICRLWSTATCVSAPSVLALPNHHSGNVPHPTLRKLLTYIGYVVH